MSSLHSLVPIGAFGHNLIHFVFIVDFFMLIGKQALDMIRAYQPLRRSDDSLLRAAVAIILRDSEQGTECLMMQRAKHEQDPWSGQMSFPGGKIDPGDGSARAAAVREAYEEVGASLSEQDYIGQLDDLYGLRVNDVYSVHVACFVFKPQKALELVANHEVADMVWLPLSHLNNSGFAHDYVHPSQQSLSMPAVMIDEAKGQILWGLSLRMLINLYDLLGLPMQVLSERQRNELQATERRNLDPKSLDKITQKIINRSQ